MKTRVRQLTNGRWVAERKCLFGWRIIEWCGGRYHLMTEYRIYGQHYTELQARTTLLNYLSYLGK